jgi:nicotinic acid phosphoribosyltransferase
MADRKTVRADKRYYTGACAGTGNSAKKKQYGAGTMGTETHAT